MSGKNLILRILLLLVFSFTTGCSLFSSDGDEGQETAVTEESSEEEILIDGEDSADSYAEGVDEYPDDDYGSGEDSYDEETVLVESEEVPSDDLSDSESELYVTEESSGSTSDEAASSSFNVVSEDGYEESSQADTSVVSSTDTYSAGADEISGFSVVQEGVSDSEISYGSQPVQRTFTPVKKMTKSTYERAGSLLNRLYIVRDGDSMSTIAKKVYGDSSRSSDLLKWNSFFKNRSIKVGDKIYYSSAKQPGDNSRIKLFYEENNVAPSYYTTTKKEDTRKLSQKLLGHPRSWMEIWATNENLDQNQKWSLPAGTRIAYYEGNNVPQVIAKADVPKPQPVAKPAPKPIPKPVVKKEIPPAPPEPVEVADVEPEEDFEEDFDESLEMEEPPAIADAGFPEEVSDGGLPPAIDDGGLPPDVDDSGFPPAVDDMAMDEPPAPAIGSMDEPPPPPPADFPPPTQNVEPPPSQAFAPPSAGRSDSRGGMSSVLKGQDDTLMMGVIGGLLIVAGIILLIFIRRSRKKVKYT